MVMIKQEVEVGGYSLMKHEYSNQVWVILYKKGEKATSVQEKKFDTLEEATDYITGMGL